MAIGSKILVYSRDKASREKLVRFLMFQKFIIKAVDAIPYVTLAIGSGEFPIFLCTLSPDDTELFDYLKQIRQDEKMRSVKPVVVLKDPTRDSLTDLIKIGCSNLVLQDAGEQALLDKVEMIAASIGDNRDRRQYVRILIPEYEAAQLLITAKNGNKYPVRVSNISMGGVQLEWSADRVPVQKMNVGDVLMNCLLIIKNLDLYADMRVTSAFSGKAGLQFTNLNEERQATLCDFMYERILSEKVR